MQVRRRFKITAARDVADILVSIIGDDCKMIAARHVLAYDNGVAPSFRVAAASPWRTLAWRIRCSSESTCSQS